MRRLGLFIPAMEMYKSIIQALTFLHEPSFEGTKYVEFISKSPVKTLKKEGLHTMICVNANHYGKRSAEFLKSTTWLPVRIARSSMMALLYSLKPAALMTQTFNKFNNLLDAK